jgi:hypothetical protein
MRQTRKYFVSYSFETQAGAQGVGNAEAFREEPISSMEDINSIQIAIAQKLGYRLVTIQYWQKFE